MGDVVRSWEERLIANKGVISVVYLLEMLCCLSQPSLALIEQCGLDCRRQTTKHRHLSRDDKLLVPNVILAAPQRESEIHHNAKERRRGIDQLPARISRANLLDTRAVSDSLPERNAFTAVSSPGSFTTSSPTSSGRPLMMHLRLASPALRSEAEPVVMRRTWEA